MEIGEHQIYYDGTETLEVSILGITKIRDREQYTFRVEKVIKSCGISKESEIFEAVRCRGGITAWNLQNV